MKVRLALGTFLVLLIACFLTASAATVYPPPDPPPVEGPTSLETSVSASRGDGSVSGTVSILNVGENTADITGIRVVVEARRDNRWIEVGEDSYSGGLVGKSGTLTASFGFSFATDPADKAYRAVSYVTLANHPTGVRVFISRGSF